MCLNLYTSMVSIAKGYQLSGALAKAIQIVEKTGASIDQMLPGIGPDETAVRERVLTLLTEIHYHKVRKQNGEGPARDAVRGDDVCVHACACVRACIHSIDTNRPPSA